MNITLSDVQGKEVYILPHIPAGIEYPSESDNETMDTLSGKIRIVGEDGLQSISWSGIFPVNKTYTWTKIGSIANGYNYIKFIENQKKKKLPIRLIITDDLFKTIFNALVSIDSFTYSRDKVLDINYQISVTEFPADKWDYLNSSLNNNLVYAQLIAKSLARKSLQKYGLI